MLANASLAWYFDFIIVEGFFDCLCSGPLRGLATILYIITWENGWGGVLLYRIYLGLESGTNGAKRI